MKINLTEIDTENFITRPSEIAGEMCYLIFPQHIGCSWSKHNLHFRSSIWNSEGELISASFKKFFNWGEQPDLCYTPFSLTANGGCQIMEKLDGSTLIVSKYKGELIVRTRGTTDASFMENAHELDILKEKYPKAFEFPNDTADYSRLFEWESPLNRIVIKHDEADIKLIGVINHDDYSLSTQKEVDVHAQLIGVTRPKVYEFNSIKEMQDAVEVFKGVEGVCVYCNKGQEIRKIKGVDYLARHRLKDQLGSYERVVDFYFTQGCPNYNDFYTAIEDAVDWETAEECRGDASRIVDGMRAVNEIMKGFDTFVEKISTLETRKDQAIAIQQAYGGGANRTAMVFAKLDGRELTSDQVKKLLYQVTKK